MTRGSFLVLAVLAWACCVVGRVLEYDFVVEERIAAPDGFERPMLMVNGQYPGPMIRAKRGDWVRVNVTNNLETQATVLHWHGIIQGGSSHMDGVPQITQCPILPGQSFLYEFDTKFQTGGTHWWHSHLGTQRGDGLIGPLILDDDDSIKEKYDEDFVFMLNDWEHTSAESLYAISEHPPYNLFLPSRILVNGMGRTDCANDEYRPLPGLSCEDNAPYNRTTIQSGKRYRLRFINAASHTDSFWVSIDHHEMTVIEVDGVRVEPLSNVTSLHIATGQRVSVILYANRGAKSYWMRVTDREGVEGLAIIDYVGSKDDEPTTAPLPSGELGITTDWMTRYGGLFGSSGRWFPPRDATRDLTFNVTLERSVDGSAPPRWGFNGKVFHLPSVPALISYFHNLPYETNVMEIGMFEVIYITVNNLEAIPHPFHLHGHLFFELGGGPGVYDPKSSELWDYKENPVPVRDTFLVEGNSWKRIAFTANNPGMWLFHCHVETHFLRGLAMAFMEFTEGGKLNPLPLPPDFPQCGNYVQGIGSVDVE